MTVVPVGVLGTNAVLLLCTPCVGVAVVARTAAAAGLRGDAAAGRCGVRGGVGSGARSPTSMPTRTMLAHTQPTQTRVTRTQ